MRLASLQLSDIAPAGLRRRTVVLALVLLVHVLLMVMLLRLAPRTSLPPAVERSLVAFDVLPDAPAAPARGQRKPERKPAGGGGERRAPAPTPKIAPPAPETPAQPSPSEIWRDVMRLSSADLAASDISKMRSGEGDGATADAGAGDAQGDGAEGGGGGGERLYNADWQRKPTRAELAYYLPRSAPAAGWGMIACRTIENFQVDSCRELDQSPPGSGLSAAVRQAAWQFRVRPPRIGGRPLIGAWVRIRIEYTPTAVK